MDKKGQNNINKDPLKSKMRQSLISGANPRRSISRQSKNEKPAQSTTNAIRNLRLGKSSVFSIGSKDNSEEKKNLKQQNLNKSNSTSRSKSPVGDNNIKANIGKAQQSEKISIKVKPQSAFSPNKIDQQDQFSFSAVKQRNIRSNNRKNNQKNKVKQNKGNIHNPFDDSFDSFSNIHGSPSFKIKAPQTHLEKKIESKVVQKLNFENPFNPQKVIKEEKQAFSGNQQHQSSIPNSDFYTFQTNSFFKPSHQMKFKQTKQSFKQKQVFATPEQYALFDINVQIPRYHEEYKQKFGLTSTNFLHDIVDMVKKRRRPL